MVTSFDNNYCLIADYMPLVNPCIVPLHTGGQLPVSMLLATVSKMTPISCHH